MDVLSWGVAVVHQALDIIHPNVLRTTGFGQQQTFSAIKNSDRSRCLCSYCFNDYSAFFRLSIPTRPSRPEPKSHTAAGIGIG